MATTTLEADAPARPSPLRRTVRRAVARLALFLLAVGVVAYFGISAYVADRISHPIRKALHGTPAAYGLAYEDVQFLSTGDGIVLKGWFMPAPGGKAVLLIHGKDGIRDDTGIGLMPIAQALVQHGYAVLTFDTRAHGLSGGSRYSLGQWEQRDVAGALTYLQGRGEQEIGSLGYSMGAATELLAAPDHPEMRAIVADSAFADLSALLDAQIPRSSGLPSLFNPGITLMVQTLYGVDLLDNKPVRAVARLGDRPLLLIHSATDDLIPVSHAYALQAAAAGDPNAQLWIAPGTGHVQAFKNNHDAYLSRVLGFFDRYLH